MMSAGGEIALGKGKEEATLIGMMRILLGQKIKKIHAVDSAGRNG
jgi:hypothetical protein